MDNISQTKPKVNYIEHLSTKERELLPVFQNVKPEAPVISFEDMAVAFMLQYRGIRSVLSLCKPPTTRFNQLVFFAIREMNEPVDACTVLKHLQKTRMAAKGIGAHLAWLNGIPEQVHNPFPGKHHV